MSRAPDAWRPLSRPFVLFLTAVFAVAGAGTVLIALRHARTHERSIEASRNLDRTLDLARRMRTGVDEQLRLLYRMIEAPRAHDLARFREIDLELGAQQLSYLALEISRDERMILGQVRLLQSTMALHAARLFEFASAGQNARALQTFGQAEQARGRLDIEFDRLGSLQLARMHDGLEYARQQRPGPWVWSAGGLVFLLALLGFAWLLRRRVIVPLNGLLEATRKIRRGDYSARAQAASHDEIGRIAAGFNEMAAALGESQRTLERRVAERTAELRQLQRQLVQTEKMSAVGRLISGVAHELNNPLTSILGYTELIESSLVRAGHTGQEVAHLRIVLREADRCRKIVADLLQFVREQRASFEPVRLRPIVGEAIRLQAYALELETFRIERIERDDDPLVLGNAFKLQQALLILLHNAADAIREEGREAGQIWLDVRGADGWAEIEVRDDGTGIREPERVFDPFYTTKEVGQGTGLGLSVCFGIVREHGGVVTADNWERGARFCIRLPIAPEVTEPAANSARVLVVDHEPALLELQLATLRAGGLEATGIGNGADAIRYLEDHPVDVVVSDLQLPGEVIGPDLLRWIETHRPALLDRVLLTSDDPTRLPEDGTPCLPKPFTLAAYLEAVRRLLAGEALTR